MKTPITSRPGTRPRRFVVAGLLATAVPSLAAFAFHAALRSNQATAAPLAAPPSQASAADVRIGWDFRSRQSLGGFSIVGRAFTQRHYPRLKRLKSGDLLMTFMDGRFGWQVFSQRSTDGGATWSVPAWIKKSYKDAAANDSVAYCNPDFLQLRDGSVLLVYQRRNNRRSNENEGVEVMRSTDEGRTWGAPQWAFRGKCWEPSLLELPSGEVQLLFTDTHDNLCHVGLVRSLDKGKTWTPAPDVQKAAPEYLSRTAGATPDGAPFSMDGMAVGVTLQNGKGIVYAAECDPVGKVITPSPVTPSIIWSSLEKNWRYDDFHSPMPGPADRRWPVYPGFRGFAPYLTQLDTGEVLVQANGRIGGTGGIWTFIGDAAARRFASPSRPFGTAGFWGCLTQIAPGRVISGATTGAKGTERILLEQGVLNRPLVIAPAKSGGAGTSWFIGGASQAQGRLTARDSGAALTLEFAAIDDQVIAPAVEPEKSDGFRLSWRAPGSVAGRQFRITAAAGGSAWLESRQTGDTPWTRISSLIAQGEREGKAGGYRIDVTVPWTLLGGKPAPKAPVAAHLELLNVDGATADIITDGMPGEDANNPATWLPVRLQP